MKYQDSYSNLPKLRVDMDNWRFSHNIRTYNKTTEEKSAAHMRWTNEKPSKGGAIDVFDIKNGTVLVGAEPKKGAKYGTVGANLACEAISFLISTYSRLYKTEERILNAIESEGFSRQLNMLFKEMVLVYHQDVAVPQEIKEKNQKEFDKEFNDFYSQYKSQKDGNAIDSYELDKSYEKYETEKDLTTEEILKEYEASVMISVLTDKYFLLGTSGVGSFILYNAYEGERALGSLEEKSTLGQENPKLSYERYSRSDYVGVAMFSEHITEALSSVKSLYRYARMLERDFVKKFNSGSPFIYKDVHENKIDLSQNCNDGAFVLISSCTSFKLSQEKESIYREAERLRTIEEAKRSHLAEVQKNLEIAKDKDVYETYQSEKYDILPNLNVFLARRQGRSHIDNGIPCQDFCLSSSVEKCVVLAVADGVGSCKKSDIGSKLACQSLFDVVKLIDEKSDNEELFSSRLQSVAFRESVFKEWRKKVISCISQENNSKKISHDDIFEYASTLLFAVITENYYVVGNLGDGQVILYNQHEAVKLRKHAPKESSNTRSMVNYNGFSECFVVERYRKSEFSSVLLTTDGMYDPLENGNELYNYAKEAEKRFLENKEPYQPFCYTVDGEGYKDIFSSKTYDDCSIALAVDTSFDHASKKSRYASVSEKYDFTLIESIGDISVYASKNQNGSYSTIASRRKVNDLDIQGIKFFDIKDSYENDGYFFNVYSYTDCPSINRLYQYGMICEQGEDKPNASELTLTVYEELVRSIDILDKNGYALNQQLSHNLIVYDENRGLIFYPEAIEEKIEGQAYDNRRILSYFDSLYGKIVCQDFSFPVFKIDFNNVGVSKYLTPQTSNNIAVTRRIESGLCLENCGNECWYDKDGNEIKKGDRIPLVEGFIFETNGLFKNRKYFFVEKKNIK